MKTNNPFNIYIIDIVSVGIYLALMMIFTLVPYIGFWKFGVVEITIIPVIIGIATVHLGALGGISTSIFMGVFGYVAAITRGTWPPFLHFEVNFIPRFFVGLSVSLLYDSLKCRGNLKPWKVFIIIFSASFFNTIFVTIYLFIFKLYNDEMAGITFKFWVGLIWVNAVVEWPVSAFLGVSLFGLAKILYNMNKSYKENKW